MLNIFDNNLQCYDDLLSFLFTTKQTIKTKSLNINLFKKISLSDILFFEEEYTLSLLKLDRLTDLNISFVFNKKII